MESVGKVLEALEAVGEVPLTIDDMVFYDHLKAGSIEEARQLLQVRNIVFIEEMNCIFVSSYALIRPVKYYACLSSNFSQKLGEGGGFLFLIRRRFYRECVPSR